MWLFVCDVCDIQGDQAMECVECGAEVCFTCQEEAGNALLCQACCDQSDSEYFEDEPEKPEFDA
jgi:hypothetical protein